MKAHKLEEFAAVKLAQIYETHDYERIYDHLCGLGAGFQKTNKDLFGREFLALRLAVASHAWAVTCRENGLLEEDIQKIFLQNVMRTFQSKKFVDLAASFGEYVCLPAENEDSLAILAMVESCFRKLEMPSKIKKHPDQMSLHSAFEGMIEVMEGFRSAMESEFDGYLIRWISENGISS